MYVYIVIELTAELLRIDNGFDAFFVLNIYVKPIPFAFYDTSFKWKNGSTFGYSINMTFYLAKLRCGVGGAGTSFGCLSHATFNVALKVLYVNGRLESQFL